MNDSIYDYFGLGSESPLDVDLIERLEIIRGPSSSLYGSSAFFAVINVITKKGESFSGAKISAETATFGTSTTLASKSAGFASAMRGRFSFDSACTE